MPKEKTAEKKTEVAMRHYLFPNAGVTIEAQNIEEAIEKFKKLNLK